MFHTTKAFNQSLRKGHQPVLAVTSSVMFLIVLIILKNGGLGAAAQEKLLVQCFLFIS